MGEYGRGYRSDRFKDKPLIMQQVLFMEESLTNDGIQNAIFTCEDCRARYGELSEAHLTYLNVAATIERHYLQSHVGGAQRGYAKALRNYDVQELLQRSSDAIYMYLKRLYEKGYLARTEFLAEVKRRTRVQIRAKAGERAGAQVRLFDGSALAYRKDPVFFRCKHGAKRDCAECRVCKHGKERGCKECFRAQFGVPIDR